MRTVKLLFTFCLILFFQKNFAQSDTTFWFAAPQVSFNNAYNSGLDRPIVLHITNGNSTSTITISMPSNPSFIPITQSLTPNSNTTIDLTAWINQIETTPANQVLNTGILIKSSAAITAYYENTSADCSFCNPEIFILKGKNALGTNFFIPSQIFLDNNPNYNPIPKSSFDIVATEDNTTINITPAKDIVGHTAGSLFTISLNKGQTFSSTAVSGLAANHLAGSIVTSNKNIAITIKDDLLDGGVYGACADLGGDQIIPISLLGTKYIPIRGFLNAPYDKVFVMAVSNNTQLKVDGTIITTLNSGNTYTVSMNNPVSYIETSLPAYVLQLSGFGCEIGLANLPPIECTGSTSINATRSTTDNLFLNILVPSGGQNSFKYDGTAGIITPADFSVVPFTSGLWYYASKNISTALTPGGAAFSVTNSSSRFQLGVVHGNAGWGARFGYFSDYNTFKANISSNNTLLCSPDTLRLHADSISNTIIQWTGPNGFTSNTANPKIFVNTANAAGYYKCIITDPTCGTVTDSILVTVNFPSVTTNNNTTICTGSSVQLNTTGAVIYSWSPSTGLSNPNIANPIATPTSTTQYIVTGTTASGCVGKDTVIITVTPPQNFDFSYQQNVCNPLSVQFFAGGATPVNPFWNFGDGNTVLGNSNPTNIYLSLGNYTVKYHIDNATCPDTITKLISMQLANADIISTNDTTICLGSTKQLKALPSGNFCWSPITYLDNPNTSTPITSTTQNITYYYTAEKLGNNLITNWDFSAGNTGFSSDYSYATSNTTQNAAYGVVNNPTIWNAGTASCTDHTTGTGNMYVANGATIPGIKAWKSSVTVNPNTNYQFSAWIQSISLANFAIFKFYINGVPFGPTLNAPSTGCQWIQQKFNWNSGNNTTANLSLEDFTYDADGNDFALDDISFATASIQRDSVKIAVDSPLVVAVGNNAVCSGTPVQLNATGTVTTYSWSPSTGLSNANIANPIATPAITTRYILNGTTSHGCKAKDSVLVTIKPRPSITKTPDTTICKNASVQLLATGGDTYLWTPPGTLNNPNIANPIATPVNTNTTYYLTVTNTLINNCTNSDSVNVAVRPTPIFNLSPAGSTCTGINIQLNASGGNKYLWIPTTLVSNPYIANPMSIAFTTTDYSVTITETNCNISQTLSTTLVVNPLPQVSATKSNDIDCSIDFAQLQATGAASYTWSPAISLNNRNIANPIAKPIVTTQYTVNGIDSLGCRNTDTLTVAVTGAGKSGYYMPNSFTPNGDGLNDCFGIKYWGVIEDLQFSIYNRWGERVFYTTSSNHCWDGTYKSNNSEAGNYVYYIKAKTFCGNVEKKGNVLLIR